MNLKKSILTISAILGILLNTNAQSIPSNGLIGWWPFNGDANDESGNGNHGTISGAKLTTDRFGNANSAFNFNGTNDVIYIDSFFIKNNLNKLSYSFWMKRNLANEFGRKSIIVANSESTNGEGYTDMVSYNEDDQRLGFMYYCYFKGYYTIQTQVVPKQNQWSFVVVTRDQKNMKIYIDGKYVSSAPYPQTVMDVRALTFGGHWIYSNNQRTYCYNGVIDDIRIYNRDLNQSEVTALYNEGICKSSVTSVDTLFINANITSFNPIIYQNSIKIYPNPTNDAISIDFGSNFITLDNYKIKISNNLGQIVYEATISKQNELINFKNWNGKGIYFIELIDGTNNVIENKKIVLQ
jgi:hypothetical protein